MMLRIQRDIDVLIRGSLVNVDVAFAEALERNGLRCVVARPASERPLDGGSLPAKPSAFSLTKIVTYKSRSELLRLCYRSSSVMSITASLLELRHWLFLVRLPWFPPVINVMTGSDMTEMVCTKTRQGASYRWLLRNSALNWMQPYPDALVNIADLRLDNHVFWRLPWLLPDRSTDGKSRSGPLDLLHCSHLDWGVTDNSVGRRSTKGNDRFIRALCKAGQAGADLRCTILDRGPDRHLAKQLISNLGCEHLFEWTEPQSQAGLKDLFASADLVVDQFDVGGFGAIAMEAMAQGKPVMIWLDPLYVASLYQELPPVINCHTEEEMVEALLSLEDVSLTELGEAAFVWVQENHRRDVDIIKFIELWVQLTDGVRGSSS